MNATQVLVISRDSSLAGRIRAELALLGGMELHVVEGLERAFSTVGNGDHQVVVAHLNAGIDRTQLGRMMREVAAQQISLTFVAVSDSYKTEEAIDLFQLGVADYLSLADHRDQIAPIIKSISAACAVPYRNNDDEERERDNVVRTNSRRSRLSSLAP